MGKYEVYDVANWFLNKEPMTHKKLQKMLYFAYAWTLALLNEKQDDLRFRLFNEKIEAWVHGPVVPTIYQYYREYGWTEIPPNNLEKKSSFSADVLDVLEQVWKVYGKYSGNELELITHKDAPWKIARGDLPSYVASANNLSDIEIFKYYNEQGKE